MKFLMLSATVGCQRRIVFKVEQIFACCLFSHQIDTVVVEILRDKVGEVLAQNG